MLTSRGDFESSASRESERRDNWLVADARITQIIGILLQGINKAAGKEPAGP